MHSIPVIEGYKILSRIGEGATSVVWKAHQLSLDRTVVIKVLSDNLSREPEDANLFLKEAQTAAKLKHSGIVQVYDFGQIKGDGRYFLVMEHVSGYTVGEWARRRGRLKEFDAVVIAHHVGEALKYAWDQARVIHCDIKPENLMIDADGTVKVMDLGLAHMVFSAGIVSAGSGENMVMGTPNYMSPEQASGNDNLDCRTDIYALGLTLYHVLTGVLPYGSGDALDILERQAREPLVNPQSSNPELSDGITRLILKMTEKNIAGRYQDWTGVLADLVVLLHKQREQSAAGAAQNRDESKPGGRSAKSESAGADNTAGFNEGFKECPYCAEPIRKKAIYCRYCGKDIRKPQPKHGPAAHTSVKLRLKPVAMPVPARTESSKKPQVKTGRKCSHWAGNLRMMISLLLLAFLAYYWYNRLRYKRDVVTPLKSQFMREVGGPAKIAAAKMIKKVKGFLDENFEDLEEDNSYGK